MTRRQQYQRIKEVSDRALEYLFHALDAEIDCNGDTAGRIWAAAYHATREAIAREYPEE
jgi:hypothetical protein